MGVKCSSQDTLCHDLVLFPCENCLKSSLQHCSSVLYAPLPLDNVRLNRERMTKICWLLAKATFSRLQSDVAKSVISFISTISAHHDGPVIPLRGLAIGKSHAVLFPQATPSDAIEYLLEVNVLKIL